MSIFTYTKCETKRSKFFGTTNRLPTVDQSQAIGSGGNASNKSLCCVPTKGSSELINDKFFSGKNRFGVILKGSC